MADVNIPVNDAPTEQAHAVAPPTMMDDQIFLSSNWVPIGKSNCVLDVQKSQRNPISLIVFWDTMCFKSSTGLYSYQLDEQWFNLHKDVLIDALDITPTNDNNHFVAPPLSKIAGYDKPRHHVLQILWDIIHNSNIDYAERIWEEFVQSIQTFLIDKNNLATASRGKKKMLICLSQALVGKEGREIFGMPIHDALLTDEIKGAPYYGNYQEHVAKYQQYMDAINGKAKEGEATESLKATKRRTPMPTEAFRPADSPSLDAELDLTESETESDDVAPKINTGDQDEGRARPNPDLETTDALPLQNPEQLDEEFTTNGYPIQENLKPPFEDSMIPKEPEEEPRKTNAKAEVQSMVSVPPMTTPVSKAVDEIVTDAVDWAMQALLRASFSYLLVVVMKEILQQRMFEDKSYEAHEDYKKLYDALKKSLDRDYSDQLLSDLEEACQKKRKRRDIPRTPFGSPPPQPPPPPPLAGASSNPGTSGASGSSQLPLTPPPSSASTSGFAQQQGSSSKIDHLPTADSRKGWWKPLPVEERPATPKPAWTIPFSTVSDVENNWTTTLVSAYETPAKNSLVAKTEDMTNFLNWYCRQVNKTIEECHKMLIDHVYWMNLEGDQIRIDVNRPLPLGGFPGYVTIQTQFFFNKDLEHLRYGSKGSSLALSISKMKAASYPELVLNYSCWSKCGLMIHAYPSRRKEVRSTIQILSDVRIKAYSRYEYDYLSEIVLRRADFQEYTIAEKEFKNLHTNDFKDLNLFFLQGHLDHLPGSDKRMLSTTVKLWTRNLVIRQRVEDF
nr:hypothetical protein [Tanacetum cinerariifolium]